MRIFSLLCCFVALTAIGAQLRICPSCGFEDLDGNTLCTKCGDTLPEEEEITTSNPVEPPPKTSFEIAKADVAEARASNNPLYASLLYKNALAIMSADATSNDKALKIIADEYTRAISSLNATERNLAERGVYPSKIQNTAQVYFQTQKRIRIGSIFVPQDWVKTLSPQAIVAIRQAIPVHCPKCSGKGTEQCPTCKGNGRKPCNGPGCVNGWVEKKNKNSLSEKNELVVHERCPHCNGTAYIPCPLCRGTHNIHCKTCHGTGLAKQCRTCHGTGLTPCKKCAKQNTPSAPCPNCNGLHETICARCGGDGRIAQ